LPIIVEDSFGITRDELHQSLKNNGIVTRKLYSYPAHKFDCYLSLPADVPVVDWVSERALDLPLYAGLADDDVKYICGLIKKA
jgi:dTDP-4-amino-4,6-dideoxygalactose transaminase